MTQRLDQIGSAVPIRRTIGYRLKASVRVIEQRPYRHQLPSVVGESQRVGWRDVADCRHTEDERLDGHHVLVSQVGIGSERHCGIEMFTFVVDAFMQYFQ